MSIILIIDTSHRESSVALVDGQNLLASRSWESNRDLGEKLLTNIDAMLKEKDLTSSDIKRIAAHKGPGHYSAVRTGVVTAMALAYAWQTELVAVEGDSMAEMINAAQKA